MHGPLASVRNQSVLKLREGVRAALQCLGLRGSYQGYCQLHGAVAMYTRAVALVVLPEPDALLLGDKAL